MLYQVLCKKSPVLSFFFAGIFLVFIVLVKFSFLPKHQTFLLEIFYLLFQVLLIVLTAISANFVINRQKITGIGDYTVLIFVLIAFLGLQTQLINSLLLFGAFIGVILIHRLGKLFNQGEAAVEELELGILTGIAIWIHPLFLAYLPFVFIGVTLAKINRWRDVAAVFLGIGLVFLIRICLLFFANQPLDFLFKNIHFFKEAKLISLHFKNWFYALGFILFYLYTLYQYPSKSGQLSVKLRMFYRSVFLLIPFFFITYFLFSNEILFIDFLLLLAPFFVFLAQLYLGREKKTWINDIPLFILLFNTCFLIFQQLLFD